MTKNRSDLNIDRNHLIFSPHLTVNEHSLSTGEYNSRRARNKFLTYHYKNKKLIPKFFPCDNPCCRNKLIWAQMQLHHIIPVKLAPQLRYDIKNVLLLCPSCHRAIHDSQYAGED